MHCLKVFWSNLLEAFKFEILFKIICLIIILPIIKFIIDKYLWINGYNISFNSDIISRFFTWPSLIILVIIIMVFTICIFFEISVNIIIGIATYNNNRIKVFTVVCIAVDITKKIIRKNIIGIAAFYVGVLPFLHFVYINSLVPKLAIPNFVIGEIDRMSLEIVLKCLLIISKVIIFASTAFIPILMVVNDIGFYNACKKSFVIAKSIFAKKRLQFLGVISVFLLVQYTKFGNLKLKSSDFSIYTVKWIIKNTSFRNAVFEDIILNAILIVFNMVLLLFFIKISNGLIDLPSDYKASYKGIDLTLGQKSLKFFGGMGKKLYNNSFILKYRMQIKLGIIGILFVILFVYLQSPPQVHEPWVIGHRGCKYEIENTVNAVLAADKFKADYAEIDIQLTKDKVPIVIHDSNLLRLCDKFSNVENLTLNQIKQLNLSSNNKVDKIPTLEEVIKAAKSSVNKIGLLIELKGESHELVEKVVDIVEKNSFGHKCIFMSLNYKFVIELQKLKPEWWIGYCVFGSVGELNQSILELNIDFLAIEEGQANYNFISKARDYWLPVYIWTANNKKDIKEYLEMGASGIITDQPDKIRGEVDRFIDNYKGSYQFFNSYPDLSNGGMENMYDYYTEPERANEGIYIGNY